VEPGSSAALVEAIGAGRDIDGRDIDGLDIGGLVVNRFVPLPSLLVGERPITVDQTNASVVVGERVVVKWMRHPQPGARAPMLLGHLAAVGFTRTPTPHAAVYRDDALVAMITAYLPEAQDGWDWCVDALLDQLDGGAPADFAQTVGVLAADLHAGLATASEVFPEPVTEVPDQGWACSGLAVLDQARDGAVALGDDDGRWFAARMDQMAAEISARVPAPTLVLHPHGDLHVGQVLRWRDGHAVTDFDGNPALTGPNREPAARDIAQVRMSLLHVGEIANRRSDGRFRREIREWGTRSAADLLTAYQHRLASCGLPQIFDQTLLRPFEVEQECRELLYAARFLPRWRYAPMGVLQSWYE
jgi:maltokinase